MWRNNNILSELKNLAPNLASLAKLPVFKTPKGYFESNLQIWENLDNEPGLQIPKQNTFGVPENYFLNFAQNLNQTLQTLNTDEQTLEESLKEQKSFVLPNNYFEQMQNQVISQIEDQDAAPLLNQLDKENNFSIPENYFEQVALKIKTEIAENESQALNELSQKQVFSLPKAYFETLEEKVKTKITQQNNEQKKEAKVIQLKPNRSETQQEQEPAPEQSQNWGKAIAKWATAIAAAMTLFVGVRFFSQHTSTKDRNINFDLSAELNKLKTKDIRAYILENADDFDDDAIFAASGVYDNNYEWFDKDELQEIDIEVLKTYYEEGIL